MTKEMIWLALTLAAQNSHSTWGDATLRHFGVKMSLILEELASLTMGHLGMTASRVILHQMTRALTEGNLGWRGLARQPQ